MPVMYRYLSILQARMGSKRLPGKVMLDLCGKPVIRHIIDRLSLSKKTDRIIAATTIQSADDALCGYLTREGIDIFRGSEDDVLGRFYQLSRLHTSYAVIRATGDNPLVDPKILDETIEFFERNSYRYVKTKGLPAGIGIEVFTANLLEEAYKNANSPYEREHVTPYMHTSEENCGEYECGDGYAGLRLTMDIMEDYERIRDIYEHLYKEGQSFLLEDIIRYLKAGNTEAIK